MILHRISMPVLVLSATIWSSDFANAAGDDILSVDKTVIIQIVIFLAAIYILNTLVFKPFIRLVDRRDVLTRGAIEEADELEHKVKEIIENYEARLEEARTVATEERNKLVREGETVANGMISDARQESAAILEEAKTRLEAETAEIKNRVMGDVDEISRQIASKVLGREVRGN